MTSEIKNKPKYDKVCRILKRKLINYKPEIEFCFEKNDKGYQTITFEDVSILLKNDENWTHLKKGLILL